MNKEERRNARIVALKMIYAHEISGDLSGEFILTAFVEEIQDLVDELNEETENSSEVIQQVNIFKSLLTLIVNNQTMIEFEKLEQAIKNLDYKKSVNLFKGFKALFHLNKNKIINNDIFKYSKHLATLTLKYSDEMDNFLIERSQNWDISRIALIDKLIIRMSLCEMLYESSVPLKVSIAEGIEISKLFSTKDSCRFINGILDSIYNDVVDGKIMFESK